MDAPNAPEERLVPVRVAIRQIDYLTKGENALGQEVDVMRTAYGPGMPQNDPQFHPELEADSQALADMQSNHRFGELVMLRERAYNGLKLSGAIKDVKTTTVEGEEVEEFEEEELLDIGEASIDDLALWIQQERPTVNDVVQASDGNPEYAQKLLEAESQATNGEPRKGVLEGLSAVISRG